MQYDPWQQIVTAFQLLEKNLIAITLCHAGNEKFIANFMIQLYANAGDRGNLQPAVFDMPLQGICHDIIGISRGVLCVAENGLIIDTILNSLVNFLGSVPVSLYVVAMYFVQVVLSIFVPTTSGVAALSMPIMAPLTEMLGLNPEGAVTCFQYACKLTLMLSPAAPVTVAGIAMCRLTFQQWWKIIWKFMLLIVVLTIGFSIMSSLLPV